MLFRSPAGGAWYRSRAGVISIVAAVAVLVIGGIAWAVSADSSSSDAGRAATMDIGDAWWMDVDDPRAHALAEELAPWHLAPTIAEIGLPADEG